MFSKSGCSIILALLGVLVIVSLAFNESDDIASAEAINSDRALRTTHDSTVNGGVKFWVTANRLNRRTCPATNCGVVGSLFFREGVTVLEQKNGWARISRFYNASCVGGRSEYVDEGNSECIPSNGIVKEEFAEWVSLSFLSDTRPPDPAAGAVGLARILGGSDDFQRYEDIFVETAQLLISDGNCSERDFEEMGGWMKSVTTYKDQPVYFTYCGGLTAANRIYLNAESGRIFR